MKIVLLVLDSVGIGALPDARLFNDEGCNTLGNIASSVSGFDIPHLNQLGLGNIDSNLHLPSIKKPSGAFGRAIEKSMGKDSTTGHWEICGIELERPFPTFPKGFPDVIIDSFEKAIGISILANTVGSGTKIIDKYGEIHMETGFPIVYTSADSVFQIAMHEGIIPIKQQYEICKKARAILKGKYRVGRVIARPFIGTPKKFIRTANRKDFSAVPPSSNLLCQLKKNGKEVIAIGKINDLFAGSGITESIKTKNNNDGIDIMIKYLKKDFEGLIFTNLVDFDTEYGHRRDVKGYAQCLMDFDKRLPEITSVLQEQDLLIVTADHGNDPTAPGSDHTREYIPILVYGKKIKPNVDIGTRKSFADIGATIAAAFDLKKSIVGKSFWEHIKIPK